MKDATNKELIVGDIYGYSVDSNGVTYITIGEFTHYYKDNNASLKVLEHKKARYTKDLELLPIVKKQVSVKPNKLFKIHN